MKKFKLFFSSEKNIAKVIISLLVILAFSFVFGPNLYAQFSRQDGSEGWGYGYGYGYGFGFGFDGGTVSGYKTHFNDSAANVYGWGYGYGNLSADIPYNTETDQYEVSDVAALGDLFYQGILTPDGVSVASTSEVTFHSQVEVTVDTDVTVTIPEGTTFTADEVGDFSALTGTTTVDDSTNFYSGYTSIGSMEFGLPDLGLTVGPGDDATISISFAVDTIYNGNWIPVFHKTPGGTAWESWTACYVTAGICTFSTHNLSSFAAATSSGSGNNGGGSSSATTYCSSVTYNEFENACVSGNQYRSIATKTPAGCTVTTGQEQSRARACIVVGTEIIPADTVITSDDVASSKAFTALEKTLTKATNKALVKRLLGRILLQVELKGEAWYVNPVDGLKYYLGRPADAFAIMRKMGLGINNANFNKFEKGTVPAKFSGRIFLKVEDLGKAYYVNPLDMKMYYMGRPADAFALMRKFGLGITNANVRQMPVGEIK